MDASPSLFPDFKPPAKVMPALPHKSIHSPLAYQLAPQTLSEYVGQNHLVGPNGPIKTWLDRGHMVSVIFFGPPGVGKTALARLIATHIDAEFAALNAVMAKVQELRDLLAEATTHLQKGRKTLLFIDEIHRFNKAQQDALLPDLEKGTVTLIGATTENPYFAVNPSILSRCQVFELQALSSLELEQVLANAMAHPKLQSLKIAPYAAALLNQSQGDARRLINLLEALMPIADANGDIPAERATGIIRSAGVPHSEDSHYDMASAFIKSVRGSDVDAALYWLARLLTGGEDPRFIVRRLIILASEDIGNADPHALPLAVAAMHAVQLIGMPEAQLTLSQTTIYLAKAHKSNAATLAIRKAMAFVADGNVQPVPSHLRDAHYSGAAKLGRGQGYVYPHDFPEEAKSQKYWEGGTSFF